jgi:hypothetical protein
MANQTNRSVLSTVAMCVSAMLFGLAVGRAQLGCNGPVASPDEANAPAPEVTPSPTVASPEAEATPSSPAAVAAPSASVANDPQEIDPEFFPASKSGPIFPRSQPAQQQAVQP